MANQNQDSSQIFDVEYDAVIIGAGVAGLQAIATARRLGAVVQAYDVRPAVREQCESLGAKFVELPLETGDSEGKGGYAKAMDESFYQRQRQLMAEVVAENDVCLLYTSDAADE